MGLTDLFADIYSALSFTEVYAEAPEVEEKEEEGGESKPEEGKEEGDESEGANGEEKEGGDEEEGGDEGKDEAGEEEEEEEEEEPEDPKPKLEEECAHSAQCAPLKHHYDECVERVTAHHNDPHKGKAKGEDCIEEFFHLQHCATQCAAPKLFRMLK